MGTWMRDLRLSQLPRTIPESDSSRTADSIVNRMEAAVAIIVRPRIKMDLLLIKRATNKKDPWSGHMALPGGRWEPGDSDLQETVVRETLEETGVDLTHQCLKFGRLEDFRPQNPTLPIARIAPFVFAVPPKTEAWVASQELESIHWVPIDLLTNPATTSSTAILSSGLSRRFRSYHVDDEHVWGLTYRIISRFLEVYLTDS